MLLSVIEYLVVMQCMCLGRGGGESLREGSRVVDRWAIFRPQQILKILSKFHDFTMIFILTITTILTITEETTTLVDS